MEEILIINKKARITPIFILTLIAILLFLLIINLLTPMIGEDYALSPSLDAKNNMDFNQLLHWIVDRIIIQSTTWNARLGEQLAIIFLAFNKNIFNVFNSLMVLVYGYLCFRYAFNRRINFKDQNDFASILLISVLLVAFMPALGEIFFWETGATNYLWSLVLLLVFGYPYRILLDKQENLMNGKPVILALYYVLSFLSGMTNENTTIVFLGLILMVFLIFKMKKIKIFTWMYISSFLYVLGIIYLLLSPSTKIRSGYYNEIYGVSNMNIGVYFARLESVIWGFLKASQGVLIVFIFMFVLYLILNKFTLKQSSNQNNKDLYILLLILFLSGASILALIMAPYYEQRAFLLPITLLIMNIIYLFSKILNFFKPAIFKILICLVLIGVFTYNTPFIFSYYKNFANEAESRENNILYQSRKTSTGKVSVQPYESKSIRILNTREDYLMGNKHYSNYYGLNEIIISPNKPVNTSIELNVPIKKSEMLYNIETIEVNNDYITIKGWAFKKNLKDLENPNYLIELVSDTGDKYKFEASIQKRVDVTNYFKDYKTNLDNTGFIATIPVELLNAGNYRLNIIIGHINKAYIQETEQMLTIN